MSVVMMFMSISHCNCSCCLNLRPAMNDPLPIKKYSVKNYCVWNFNLSYFVVLEWLYKQGNCINLHFSWRSIICKNNLPYQSSMNICDKLYICVVLEYEIYYRMSVCNVIYWASQNIICCIYTNIYVCVIYVKWCEPTKHVFVK